jgi:hypothetical protein
MLQQLKGSFLFANHLEKIETVPNYHSAGGGIRVIKLTY